VPGENYKIEKGALVARYPKGAVKGDLYFNTSGVIFPNRTRPDLRTWTSMFDAKSEVSLLIELRFPYDEAAPDFVAVDLQGLCVGDSLVRGREDLGSGQRLGRQPRRSQALLLRSGAGRHGAAEGTGASFRLEKGTRYTFEITFDPAHRELRFVVDGELRYRLANVDQLGKGRIEIRAARRFAIERFRVTGRPDSSWARR
jgi:hypothetical protein